ncbi:type 2 lanthipeptide synthetase LanM family protein [Peribacillus simplex]
MVNLHKALTIDERYNILEDSTITENNTALFRWRQEMSIISEQTFNESLRVKQYKKILFSHAVDYDPPEELKTKYTFASRNSEWYKFFLAGMELVTSNDNQYNNFLHLLRPFLKNAFVLLNQFFSENRYRSLLTENGMNDIFAFLETELSDIAYRTIVLELNLEREQGLLKGDTPEERFLYFIKGYNSKEKLNVFYDKYIVLTRLLSTRTQFYLKNIKEMIRNIEVDSDEIKKTFGIDRLEINSIKFGEGDTHQQGKTVTVFQLEDGPKLVYKPKNLYINHAYNRFINWLNSVEEPKYKKLKTLPTLSKEEHSYEQFIEYKSCQDMVEVDAFYQRFGQLMAIIQLLNGTDIHMENLISHGSHPIIVDLETLVQRQNPISGENEELTLKEIRNRTFRHVTRTLFLPTNGVKLEKLDLSALNGRESVLNYKVLQPVNEGTDQIKYDYLDYKLKGSNNLPFLEADSVTVNYKTFKKSIIAGFELVYNMVIQNKEKLRASGVIEEFEKLKVRVLLRDTSQYATILMHMQHPEMLTDMLDREKALENMWAFPFADKEVIKLETKDMLDNDIPIFYNITTEHDLEGSLNDYVKGYYDYTPYDYLVSSLDELSHEELKRQLSIISLSFGDFSTTKREFNKGLLGFSEPLIHIDGAVDKSEFLQEAVKIADRIMEKSISIDKVNWIIPYNASENAWSLIPMNDDFYNGIAGLYLYFNQMYNVTNDSKYKEFYQKMLNQCEPNLNFEAKLGLTGYPGYLHAFSLIDDYAEDKIKIYKYINDYCKKIEEIIVENSESIQEYDFINGVASLINSLVRLHTKTPMPKYLELAMKYADLVIENYEIKEDYSFGHGNLGIGTSIMKLAKLTRVKKHEEYAQKLIQSSLVALEHFNNKQHWCTGALGAVIGLRELKVFLDADVLVEETAELQSELQKEAFLNNDSLCHGNMGLTDLFLSSSDSRDIELARKIGLTVKNLKEANGYYKLMDTEEYPDVTLFTGLAGIGYQYLRLFSPGKVPSVLS